MIEHINLEAQARRRVEAARPSEARTRTRSRRRLAQDRIATPRRQ